MVREGLTAEVTFEQRLEGSKGASREGKTFGGQGTANAKALIIDILIAWQGAGWGYSRGREKTERCERAKLHRPLWAVMRTVGSILGGREPCEACEQVTEWKDQEFDTEDGWMTGYCRGQGGQ